MFRGPQTYAEQMKHLKAALDQRIANNAQELFWPSTNDPQPRHGVLQRSTGGEHGMSQGPQSEEDDFSGSIVINPDDSVASIMIKHLEAEAARSGRSPAG